MVREKVANRVKESSGQILILEEPDEDAAFEKNFKIKSCEVSFMLKLGSFTPGTIILQHNCRKIVVGQAGQRQKLIPCPEVVCQP
jgi:hypothetical protein